MDSTYLQTVFNSIQCHVILQKSFQFADLLFKKHFPLLLLSIFKTVEYFFNRIFLMNRKIQISAFTWNKKRL